MSIGAMRRECCTAALLAPLGKGGLGEGGYVMARRIMGGEVGGYEKIAWIEGESMCSRCFKISQFVRDRRKSSRFVGLTSDAAGVIGTMLSTRAASF